MDVRSPLFQNVATLLIGVMFLNPILATAAELTLDAAAGGNTSLGQAGNGVPIVNIATPNGSGLSHNKFGDYNVGQQGLILNNGTERTQGTQLGGIILGNPNLKGGAAGLILNEVTGGNASQLRGYTEVAGQGAHVIVANPHGITCNGCGFINTPHATLTTGTPIIDNGRLSRFDVDGGAITVEGAGLNASNVEQFDLITRSAKINAEIYANRLNVITGRNQVDASTLSATAKADDGSDKPQLAIDSSALGGMYAGAIRLVGTEAGVGVKLAGDMAASAGDIQIDAKGHLNLAQTAASGNIQLHAASAELNGKTYAGGNINAQTAGELVNRQSLAARERIELNAAQLSNSGLIEAGVEANNSRNGRGDVSLVSQTLRNSGSVLASRDLSVQASQGLDNQGGTLSAQNTQVNAGQLDNRQGRVLASGALKVTAGSVDNSRNGLLHSQNSATVESAGTLNNQSGRVIGLQSLSAKTGVLDNSQGGLLASQQQLSVNAASLNNQGGEVSANTIDARVGSLNNSNGKLIGDQLKVRATAQVDNRQGRIEASRTLELVAASLDNSGQGTLLSQGSLALGVTGLLDNHDLGNLISHGTQQLTFAQLDNSHGGLISSKSTLDLQGATLNNQSGLVVVDGALTIKGGSLDNRQQGSVSGKAAVQLELTQLNNTGGSVASDGRMQLTAATVDNGNDGQIAAKGDLQATLGSFNQQGGALISQGALNLHANSIDNRNAGLIAANQGIELHAEHLDNQGGEISSRAKVTVTANELRNSAGKVIGDQGLELTVQRLFNQLKGVLAGRDGLTLKGVSLDNSQGGLLSSQQALRLELTGALDNHEQGQLISEGGLLVTAASLDNQQAGVLSSAGALQVTTLGLLNNQGGKLLTDDALTLVSADLNNSQAGVLSAKGAIELHSGDLDNRQGGRISSDAALTINAAQLNNSALGRISSQGLLTASLNGLDQHDHGELVSSSAIRLDLANGQLINRVASIDNSQGGEISSAHAFSLLTGNLNNSAGKIISGEALQLQITHALLNNLNGILSGTQDLTVNAASLDNSGGGTLASSGNVRVDISAELDNRNNGALVASGDLRVNSGALNNSDKGLLSSGNNLQLNSGATNNSGGQLISQAALDVQTADFNNQGGVLSSKQALSLQTGNLDNSAAGLISSASDLSINAQRLDSSLEGEISAKGNLLLRVTELVQRQGRLIGEQAVTLDLAGGNFDNRGGLLSAHGPLSIQRLAELDNRDLGEISSQQSFSLLASKIDNGEQGRIISADTLSLNAASLRNAGSGLISGWQGLTLQGANLDNSASGTLSSKQGALTVNLSGALDNHGQGALVSQGSQQVSAASLNNLNGILSTDADLDLAIAGQLNNSAGGLITAKQGLTLNTATTELDNQGGQLSAASVLLKGKSLNNNGGQVTSQGRLEIDLLGALINANLARLASGGALILKAASIDNSGGKLISQNSLRLTAGQLDNSAGGTLASQQDLQLSLSGALSNQQSGLIYSQLGKLLLTAGSLNNQEGTLQSATDSQLRITGALNNQHGQLSSQGGNLDLQAGSLDNSNGGILSSAHGWLKLLTAGLFDNHAGTTQAQSLELNAAQGIDNHSGHLSAVTGDNLIVTQDFNNQGGGLYAGILLKVTGQQFLNQGAELGQGGKVGAGRIDFGLTGALNNQFGILESDSTLSLSASSISNVVGRLRALGQSGSTHIASNSLNNNYGVIESANHDLNLQVASLTNGAGSILHIGNGNFGLSADNVMQAGGNLTSNGMLTLNAASWVNSSVLQAGRLNLNIGNFTQTAAGQLLASQALTGNGNTWVNDGLLASDGSLSLNLSGGYSGNGRLTSLGDLSLSAASIALGEPGRISSGGNGQISSSGNLTNYGRLTSASDLRVNAANLANHGTLGSAGALRLYAPSLLNVYGLIFSGEDMALRVNDFTNKYADVYSLGDLDIAANDLLGRANLIENISATIESVADMSVRANALNNSKDQFAAELKLYSGRINLTATDDCDGKHCWALYNVNEVYKSQATQDSASANLLSGRDFVFDGGNLVNRYSTVSAGQNVDISSTTFSNIGAAGGYEKYAEYEIYTKSESSYYGFLTNKDRYNAYNDPASASYNPGYLALAAVLIGVKQKETLTPTSGNVIASAVIQAGGNVNIQASQSLESSVILEQQQFNNGGTRIVDAAASASGGVWQSQLNAQLPPDLAQQQINPLTLPGFSLPAGQNGLFRLSDQNVQNGVASAALAGAADLTIGGRQIDLGQREQTLGYQGAQGLELDIGALSATSTGAAQAAATLSGQATVVQHVQGMPSNTKQSNGHKYLIETNPALTDLKQFMSSDYLLGLLGVTPDNSQKRLGDGLYEQRLIREAVVARTGQRFLDGLTSDEAMFRYLMDNAIASKQRLNLSVGVTLTAAQVAALTHDLVWLEEYLVNGEKVLVPVLYLAQAKNRLAPNGALIQGQNVSLIAGTELNNAGTLRAANNLSASATNISNSGLMEAGQRLDLLATDSIRNAQGGIISGRDVRLTALTGDVLNERTVTQHAGASGSTSWTQSFADSAARIEASNRLDISAGRDIANLGGVLQSRGDLSLDAGRDVTIASVEGRNGQTRGSRFNSEQITQLGAEVAAGRDLTTSTNPPAAGSLSINAGRDLNVIASKLEARRDLGLIAGRDVTLAAAANEEHFYSKSKKVTRSADKIVQQSTSVQAGGNVSIDAGQDLTLVASKINAQGDVALDAEQDINILSAKDESASFYSKKSKGSFGRSKSKQSESYDSTNIASVIEAGNDLTINASQAADGGMSIDGGRDVNVIGSQLKAGNDLLVGATGDVAILSGVEEHGSYTKKSKSGFGGFSKSGKSQLQTSATQVASELDAGNDVVIAAGNDIRLRASQASAGNDVELRAGLVTKAGDINLVSANDTAYSLTQEYKKKTGLSASGGMLSIASAQKAGEQAQSSTSVGSQVTADRDATLKAAQDINIVGSGVNAGRNVLLDAGRDVNVVAAESSRNNSAWQSESKTGIALSSDRNGVSAFIGKEKLQETTGTVEHTAAASQIQAGQDVSVQAGRDINQHGSDIAAERDISLRAVRDINLDAAAESLLEEESTSKSRNGLTVNVSHNYGNTKDAVNGAGQGDNNVSKGSSTLKAVDAVNQFTSGPSAAVHLGSASQTNSSSEQTLSNRASTLDAGRDISAVAGNALTISGSQLNAGRDISLAGKDVTLDVARGATVNDSQQVIRQGGINGGTAGGFKVGVGGSYGEATEAQTQGSALPTQLQAGRDVDIKATHDLTLIGTQVKAVRDIALNAGNDLIVRAATNEFDDESKRHSGGGEVGLAVGSGGIGVYASVNLGKGQLEREGDRQQEAYLYAGDRLKFTSGQDTTIAGATLRGDEVIGRVGGDLNVSSLPDTGKVKGKEFDISATVTVGVGASASGSVGYGQTTGKTNWVDTQTSITAKDRLDIRTENHTQLDGALLASDSGNLKLDTGTLGYRDIKGQDKEHGYYLNVGGSYGFSSNAQGADGKTVALQDVSQQGKGNEGANGWSVSGYDYNKDREQIVRATVGAGEIVVRGDAQTGQDSTAGLNRDVDKAYVVTKDEEERTDLYASQSSIEAVSHPVATYEQWKQDLGNYKENSLETAKRAAELVEGSGRVVQQVWQEIQAQQVSLESLPNKAREALGDEQALAVAKNLVRNGKSIEEVSKYDKESLEIIVGFSKKFQDFNYSLATCQARGECKVVSDAEVSESQRGKIYHYYDDQGVKRSVLLTGVVALTAGEKLLAKTDQLLTYAEKLPVEQAQLLFIGLQAVMGPAKAAVGLAGNILVSKLFGEQLAEVKNNAAVAIADSLTREEREHLESSDEVFDALSAQGQIDQKGDVYVRGATGLLDIALGSFGSIAGKIGSKVVGKVITVVPKDKPALANDGHGIGGREDAELGHPVPDKPVKTTPETTGGVDKFLSRPDVDKVVQVPAGSKGNWDKTINGKLEPKTAYVLDNGHAYVTDAVGRVKTVEGQLIDLKMDRNGHQQGCVGKCGEAGDEGGHLIASALGGSGDRINVVPQDKLLNRGDWRAMERQFQDDLRDGKSVSVKIEVGYPSDGGPRPSNFLVTALIDGEYLRFPFSQ
jgi:filamentous hemagglutinin